MVYFYFTSRYEMDLVGSSLASESSCTHLMHLESLVAGSLRAMEQCCFLQGMYTFRCCYFRAHVW